MYFQQRSYDWSVYRGLFAEPGYDRVRPEAMHSPSCGEHGFVPTSLLTPAHVYMRWDRGFTDVVPVPTCWQSCCQLHVTGQETRRRPTIRSSCTQCTTLECNRRSFYKDAQQCHSEIPLHWPCLFALEQAGALFFELATSQHQQLKYDYFLIVTAGWSF